MRPRNSSTRRRSAAASPEQERRSFTSLKPISSLHNGHGGYLEEDMHQWLSDEPIEHHSIRNVGSANPRSFSYSVKQQCWEKADKVKGRDPDRWRRDFLGNIIFRKLVGCPGCLCHDYDHIVPYSKGGKSTLENCQVLQATVNRSKGNKTEISKSDLIKKSAYCRVSGNC